MQNTISATAFNRTGSIFAYAVSYDWSKVLLLSLLDAVVSIFSHFFCSFAGLRALQPRHHEELHLFACHQ